MEEWLKARHYKVTLAILLLAAIAIFSFYKYARSLNERYRLRQSLSQSQARLDVASQENQKLLQALEKEKISAGELEEENSKMLRNLKASTKRLDKLFKDYTQAQGALEKANAQVAGLNKELKQVTQERDDLQAKFTSVSGLKKAISELKWQARKVTFQMKDAAESPQTGDSAGNQGFIVRDGKSTSPAKVKIEVSPASAEAKPASKE